MSWDFVEDFHDSTPVGSVTIEKSRLGDTQVTVRFR